MKRILEEDLCMLLLAHGDCTDWNVSFRVSWRYFDGRLWEALASRKVQSVAREWGLMAVVDYGLEVVIFMRRPREEGREEGREEQSPQ